MRRHNFFVTDPVERKLATGDFKGRLQTWDLERCGAPLTSTPAHTGLINAIDGAGGKARALTALSSHLKSASPAVLHDLKRTCWPCCASHPRQRGERRKHFHSILSPAVLCIGGRLAAPLVLGTVSSPGSQY